MHPISETELSNPSRKLFDIGEYKTESFLCHGQCCKRASQYELPLRADWLGSPRGEPPKRKPKSLPR